MLVASRLAPRALSRVVLRAIVPLTTRRERSTVRAGGSGGRMGSGRIDAAWYSILRGRRIGSRSRARAASRRSRLTATTPSGYGPRINCRVVYGWRLRRQVLLELG